MSQLTYLATAYFHPDWDVEASTPLGVLANFVRDEPPEDVATLRDELAQVLAAGPNEHELGEIWLRRHRALWDPVGNGWSSYAEWFEAMLGALAAGST